MATSFLRDVLKPDRVKLRLQAATKDDAIRELIDILAGPGIIADRAEAERVVFAREALMSTGMECGIAIPHGKTDSVGSLVVSMALKPEGIEFECADGQPARILLMTLSPANRTGPHIRFMAEVSRLLRNEKFRERVLAAGSREEIVALLTQ